MTPKAKRPQKLESKSLELPCPCGRIYVHVTFDSSGQPFEVFARLGKSGGCGAAVTGAMTTTVSIALRSGTFPEDIARGLIGVSCHRSAAFDNNRKITSCADAIGVALLELTPRKEGD